MKTLGVDLASQAARTATCVLEWGDGRARIVDLAVNADDTAIVAMKDGVDAIGIDAPFGWPASFIAMLSGQDRLPDWTTTHRDTLRFRATDKYIRDETGRWPLSVSSDLIGVVAMRCRGLLQQLGVGGHVLHPSIYEVYPAAALRRWSIHPPSYQRAKRRATLARLVETTRSAIPWLDMSDAALQLLKRSDDAFDALISSMMARAARLGLCDAPPDEPHIAQEGWIFLPKERSLQMLCSNKTRA